MEPQSNNLEHGPNQPEQNPESLASPDNTRKMEKFPIGALEQLGGNESGERSGTLNAPQAAADATTLALPTIQPVQDSGSGAISATPTPVAAADDDVIEKEWVNKAKKVINATKGDPYAKEREVSKLQADYMQKRYGKQVKMPDESE